MGPWRRWEGRPGLQTVRARVSSPLSLPLSLVPAHLQQPWRGKERIDANGKKNRNVMGFLRVLGLLQQEERFAGGGAGSAHLRLLRRVSGLAPLLRHLWVPGTLPGAAKRSRFNG